MLRLIVVIEGPLHVVAGVRKATSSMLEGALNAENKFKRQAQLAGQNVTFFRKITLLRFPVLQPVSAVVTSLTYIADYIVDAYVEWRGRSRRMKLQA